MFDDATSLASLFTKIYHLCNSLLYFSYYSSIPSHISHLLLHRCTNITISRHFTQQDSWCNQADNGPLHALIHKTSPVLLSITQSTSPNELNKKYSYFGCLLLLHSLVKRKILCCDEDLCLHFAFKQRTPGWAAVGENQAND